MLEAAPTYDLCNAIAETMRAAIASAFPHLETQISNPALDPALGIQARNPLNGDCWTGVAAVGHPRRGASTLQIDIGRSGYDPLYTLKGTPKAPPDQDAAGRLVVEYLKQLIAQQEQEAHARQMYNASREAAEALRSQAAAAGIRTNDDSSINSGTHDAALPTIRACGDPRARRLTNWPFDGPAVSISLPSVTIEPAAAARVLALYAPLAAYLAAITAARPEAPACPASGTLIA